MWTARKFHLSEEHSKLWWGYLERLLRSQKVSFIYKRKVSILLYPHQRAGMDLSVRLTLLRNLVNFALVERGRIFDSTLHLLKSAYEMKG